MKIRYQLFLAGLIMCLIGPGCVSYQYVKLNGSLPKSQYNDFFYEDDTIQVVYNFYGVDCPLKIEIFNKLDKTIYIDLNRSFAKTGVNRMSLNPYIGYDITDNFFNQTNYRTIDSIAPNEQFVTDQINLSNIVFDLNSNDSITRCKVDHYTGNKRMVKEHVYNFSNSPLHIHTEIAYSCTKNTRDLKQISGEFWVSRIFKSASSYYKLSPDRYMVAKESNGDGLNVLLGTLAVTAYVISSMQNGGGE